jgi:HAD superfamily hydrolase (TIGR01459 family)
MTTAIRGLGDIADAFDALIIDQFGVLHDGMRAYAGVEACLRRLREAGKRMVVLSNSGRRAEDNRLRLGALGLPVALLEDVVTSGEVAWKALRHRDDPFHRALGARCLLIAEAHDTSFVDGLDLTVVGSPEAAEFVLVVGIDTPARDMEHYEPVLRASVACGLPLLCANNDFVRITPSGLHPAPGALARRYAEIGGSVHRYGKPLRPIFEQCLARLNGVPRDRVLVVGDSIEHDVLGAHGAGLPSVHVQGGVEAGEPNGALDERAAKLFATPLFRVPEFRW